MQKKKLKSAVKPPPSFGYRRVDTKNAGMHRQKSSSKPKRHTPMKKYSLLSKKKNKQRYNKSDDEWQQLSSDNQNEDDALVYRKLFVPDIQTQSIQTSPMKQVKPPKVLRISLEQSYSFKPSQKKQITTIISPQTSKDLKKWNQKKKILKRTIHSLKSKYYQALKKGIRSNLQKQRLQRQVKSSQSQYQRLQRQKDQLQAQFLLKNHSSNEKYLQMVNRAELERNRLQQELKVQYQSLKEQKDKIQAQLLKKTHAFQKKYSDMGKQADLQRNQLDKQLKSLQKRFQLLQKQKNDKQYQLLQSFNEAQQRYLLAKQSQGRASVFIQQLQQEISSKNSQIQQLTAYYIANEANYLQQMKIVKNKLSQVQLEKMQLISNKQISFSALRQEVNAIQQQLVRLNQLYSEALADYQSSQQVTIRQHNKLAERQQQIQRAVTYIDQQNNHIETLQRYNSQLQDRYERLQSQSRQFEDRAQSQYRNLSQQNDRLKTQIQRLKQDYERQYHQYVRQKAMYTRALQSGSKRSQIRQKQAQSIRKKYRGKQLQYQSLASQLQRQKIYLNELKQRFQAEIMQKDQQYYRLQQQHLSYRFQMEQNLQKINQQKTAQQKRLQLLESELRVKQLQFIAQKQQLQLQLSQKDTQLMQRAAILEIKHQSQKDLIIASLNHQKAQLFLQGQLQNRILRQQIGSFQYTMFTKNGQVQRLLGQKKMLLSRIADLQNVLNSQPMKGEPSLHISSQYGVYNHIPALKVEISSQTQANLVFIKQIYELTAQIRSQSQKNFQIISKELQKQNQQLKKHNIRLQSRIFKLQQQIQQKVLDNSRLQSAQEHSSVITKKIQADLDKLQASTAQQIARIRQEHAEQQATLRFKIAQLTTQLSRSTVLAKKQAQIQTSNKKQAAAALQSQQSEQSQQFDQSQSQLTQMNEQVIKTLRMGVNDKVQLQLGRQLLTLKPYQGKFWWGLSIRKMDGRMYYTHQAVQFVDPHLIQRVQRYYNDHVGVKGINQRISLNHDVMMIIDQYKGDRYVGIRHYNYYGGQKQPTRYGFNVLFREFKNFLLLCNRFLE